MAELSEKMQKRREEVHAKVYAFLCVIIFVVMGLYTFFNWREYSYASQGLEKNQAFIEVLKQKVVDEKVDYEDEKERFDALTAEIEQKLREIFPEDWQKTILVRQIDVFEETLNKKTDPFEVSNLDFQEPVDDKLYSILPFRMNIRSSSENFKKFLHLVENSGALENQVRLMDISSIRLTFEGDSADQNESGGQIINFTVQVNAYFQKTNK